MALPQKSRDLAINLALFLLATAACLVVIDLYVRFFMPEYRILVDYDDQYVFTLVPNATSTGSDPDIDPAKMYTVRINSLGFKDYEFPVEKNSTRIMVYGDSFIMGSPNLENTFPKQLQKSLSQRLRKPVQVINAGVVGYGIDQVGARLDDETGAYKPDLLIVSIFAGNDFGENTRNRMYRLDAEGNAVKNNFSISPMRKLVRFVAGAFPSAQLYQSLYNQIVARPRSGDDLLEAQAAGNLAECEDFFFRNKNEVVSPFNDPVDADMVMYPSGDCTILKERLMGGILRRIKQTAARNGAGLVVMIIPPIYEVDNASFSSEPYSQLAGYDRTQLSQDATAIVEREALPFLNLQPYFAEENGKRAVYLSEGHWNTHGQAFAAQLMADKILQEGWILDGQK